MKLKIVSLIVVISFIASCKKEDNNQQSDTGKAKDIDGNVYDTVKIGTQIWMKENLKVSRFNDGTLISEVESDSLWKELAYTEAEDPAWCYANKDAANNDTFGKLYNWYAVVDSRKLCPAGWHVPSDAEYTTLTDYLGGENVAGEKMKAIELWDSPNVANNSSGFSALPANIRALDGSYSYGNYLTAFWTSSIDIEIPSSVLYRLMWNDQENVTRATENKHTGMSVRCVKD